jgi:hypothetical protein
MPLLSVAPFLNLKTRRKGEKVKGKAILVKGREDP